MTSYQDYKISFLLNSGAFISVLNYFAQITIAKLLNTKRNDTFISSKTSNVANQTEVPILHYVTLTLITTIEDDSRQFIFPSAVAEFKYKIFGTLFFEECLQNTNIQDFTLQFKYQSIVYASCTKNTSLLFH